MRKIKIKSWTENIPSKFDEEGKVVGTETVDWSILRSINILLSNKKPEETPKGIDGFRTMGRLSKAFDKAEKSKVLELEEQDYKFLSDTISKDIPSVWGSNPNILASIEEFLEAKSEDSKEK